MEIKSTALMTAAFVPFVQTSNVSTCVIFAALRAVPARACLSWLIKLTITSGPAPTPDMFEIPVTEIRYRSSDPTEIPTTLLVNAVPNCVIAFFRAVISFVNPS